MTCSFPSPLFPSPFDIGLQEVLPLRDGYSVYLNWRTAVPDVHSYTVGYNIYFSTDQENVFLEGPKYFTLNKNTTIIGFVPGDTIYFAVRATEFDPSYLNLLGMPNSPQAENSYNYPETALAEDIDNETSRIPLIDVSEFPSIGILKVGYELIQYSNIDYSDNIVYGIRGYYDSAVNSHTIDGYDGYDYYDPTVRLFAGFEDLNQKIVLAQPRIEYPEFPFTELDGYKQTITDILTTDLSSSDDSTVSLTEYDYTGYHSTSITNYFSGNCIGSYAGGEYGCADGYKVRGLNIQTANNQRQEMLLNVTGEPVVLMKRLWTGIKCSCYRLNQEHHEGRCGTCYSTSFVGGYEQFYNDKRSDGRILVRFDATIDDLTAKQIGLEQNFVPNCWTTVYPAIKDRDVLIRFNQDGTEEFRYEVVNVTRNKLLFSLSGAQKFSMYRLDKTDPIYQWRAFRNTASVPYKINTSLSILRGHGLHLHTIVLNEKTLSLNDINQTTSVMAGHNHPIINGVIQEVLGHTHDIII